MLADPNINSSLPQLDPNWLIVIEAGVAITSQLDFDRVLPTVLEQSARVCTADGAAIVLVDEQKKDETLFQVTRGSLTALPRPATDIEATSWLTQLAQPIQIYATTLASYFPSAHIRGINLIVPIISAGSPVGALVLNRSKHDSTFSPADETALFALARFAGLALENARRFGQDREQARIQERNTLAKAIHSGAAQTIFILNMEAETGLEISNLQEMRQRLLTLRHLAERAREELRGLITAMRSTQEQRQNPLAALVQKRLNNFHAQTDIPIAFHASALPEVLPAQVSEAIYRLIVEYGSTLSQPVSIAGVMVSLTSSMGKVFVQILDIPVDKGGARLPALDELEELRPIVEKIGGGSFSLTQAEEVGRLIRASFDGIS